MKKLLLTTALACGTLCTFQATTMHAYATTKNVTAKMAQNFRHGQIENSKVKLGQTLGQLQKIKNVSPELPNTFWTVNLNHQYTYMLDADYKKKPSKKTKIIGATRTYAYELSKSSVQKYFGKPVLIKSLDGKSYTRTNIYKAGTYYLKRYIQSSFIDFTSQKKGIYN